jgi:hypothetical protein
MMKISRNYQVFFYIVVLIFGIFFFFYFYKQAAVTENDFIDVQVGNRSPSFSGNSQNVQIDLNLFKSEKFKSLNLDVAPVHSFQAGKRNPFLPY